MTILQQIALGLWGILPGNYSGITHVADNCYAIVDDKDYTDGFKLLRLDIDSVSGIITNASLEEPKVMAERRAAKSAEYRDCEGVAYYAPSHTVFVSGEQDQRIMEYALDGTPTGRELQIPISMQRSKICRNLGFEALTYNDKTKRFWTTPESVLMADGEHAGTYQRAIENHLRFVAFNENFEPCASYVYKMGKITAKRSNGNSILGVPSLIALDDGRLIVMEREGFFTKHRFGSFVKVNLYLVNPNIAVQVSFDTPMEKVPESAVLEKKLICSFQTKLKIRERTLSNYEGMCLGPKLADGRQTLLLICDSQNGMGNKFFRLQDNVKVIILDNELN